MKQKHYMDIDRLQSSYAVCCTPGDYIIVQEKIDGANFSIRYDEEKNCVASFSRKNPLNIGDGLRGAYQWSQKLDVNLIKEVLGNNLILFGEWLVSHTVPYPQDKYMNAYFYDIYDIVEEKWLPQDIVKSIIHKLNLNYVPVFYEGEFTNWQDLKDLVGKTELGGEYGEGIVIKNMTRLNDPNNRLPFYVKVVCEKFKEVKPVKRISPEQAAENELLYALVDSIVTTARVVKLLHKLVDEGIIPENWSTKDMGTIAKNISYRVYEDCVKEEPDTVEQIGSRFGKMCNKATMFIVRKVLEEKCGDII